MRIALGSDLIGGSGAYNRPAGRMGPPVEVTYRMVFLASEESSYMARTELTSKWRLADTLCGAGLGTVLIRQRSRIRGHTGCSMSGFSPTPSGC